MEAFQQWVAIERPKEPERVRGYFKTLVSFLDDKAMGDIDHYNLDRFKLELRKYPLTKTDVSKLTMEQPLPAHDTSLTFDGPPEPGQAVLVEPMTFEDAGAFQCHCSKLIAICKTDEQEPTETRLAVGGYVRRLDAETVIVSDAPGDVAGDFATFHNGCLVAFGVLDRTGTTAWRYDAL